jgi:hypothetical protein
VLTGSCLATARSATRLRLRFDAANRDEALQKRVPCRSCEAATLGRFELFPSLRQIFEPTFDTELISALNYPSILGRSAHPLFTFDCILCAHQTRFHWRKP